MRVTRRVVWWWESLSHLERGIYFGLSAFWVFVLLFVLRGIL